MDDVAVLIEKAERYRRLLKGLSDPRTAAVLNVIIAELDSQIDAIHRPTTATQCAQEQPSDPEG